MTLAHKALQVLPLMGLSATLVAVAQQPAAPVSQDALKTCAAIDDLSQRLACYDHLAGRPPTPLLTPAAVPHAPPATAPVAAQPKEAFGLHSVEHPTAPSLPQAQTAKVMEMGVRPNGHPSVTLDGGQLWQMESEDPLLKVGDAVTIKRATLGSFIMTTPTGRTYRVYRLR
jgi:hypothetical protein